MRRVCSIEALRSLIDRALDVHDAINPIAPARVPACSAIFGKMVLARYRSRTVRWLLMVQDRAEAVGWPLTHKLRPPTAAPLLAQLPGYRRRIVWREAEFVGAMRWVKKGSSILA